MKRFSQKTIYLLGVLVVVIILTVIVLWRGFLTEPAPAGPEEITGVERKVRMDFTLLESEKVKQLKLFQSPPSFDEEMKRDNPFSPYTTEE